MKLLLGYISPHLALFEVLFDNSMQIEVLMKLYTNYADKLWLLQNLQYMQNYSWDSTVNQLFLSTACLAWRRQRAARHLCFNIYDTQASGLWCTLAFCMESVWNLQTKHNEW